MKGIMKTIIDGYVENLYRKHQEGEGLCGPCSPCHDMDDGNFINEGDIFICEYSDSRSFTEGQMYISTSDGFLIDDDLEEHLWTNEGKFKKFFRLISSDDLIDSDFCESFCGASCEDDEDELCFNPESWYIVKNNKGEYYIKGVVSFNDGLLIAERSVSSNYEDVYLGRSRVGGVTAVRELSTEEVSILTLNVPIAGAETEESKWHTVRRGESVFYVKGAEYDISKDRLYHQMMLTTDGEIYTYNYISNPTEVDVVDLFDIDRIIEIMF